MDCGSTQLMPIHSSKLFHIRLPPHNQGTNAPQSPFPSHTCRIYIPPHSKQSSYQCCMSLEGGSITISVDPAFMIALAFQIQQRLALIGRYSIELKFHLERSLYASLTENTSSPTFPHVQQSAAPSNYFSCNTNF